MGYFLIFEGMLESVLYARDRYLKEDGLLFPNKCRIKIAGFDDQEY
jgi:protein arginine N-methyltransferase 1